MKIKHEMRGNSMVVSLDGKLDVHTIPPVLELLDGLVSGGHVRMVIDMSRVPFISSYGLGMLVSTNKNLRERGGLLKLASLTPEVKAPFEITGLLPQFEIFESLDAAIGSN